MTETDGVDSACVWEAGRDGRRLHLRAGLEGQLAGADQRVSAARDSHAGAAIESGLHVIVDDWSNESRYSMPPALRVLGIRSSLAVVIKGKDGPFGVLDIHSTEPSRFTPAGRPLRPGLGERPRRRDRAPRRRRGAAPPRPPRLADRAPQPAQLRRLAGGSPQAGVGLRHARSGSSSSTSTTSS